MGCVNSINKSSHDVSISCHIDNISTPVRSKYRPVPEESSHGYSDLDKSILPTLSEAANEIRFETPTNSSPPSSQSHEVSLVPINVVPPENDEDKCIEDYIRTAVEYRNQHGGRSNLEKQLQKQRVELICVGAFIQTNNISGKYDIVSYDKLLPNSDLKFRPDLILKDKETNVIVHVEIDENAHGGYNKEEEQRRELAISNYFSGYNYQCVRFNPNIYENKVEMAIKFTQILNANDGLIRVFYRPKLKHATQE